MYVTMKIMEYTKSASFNSAGKTIHLYVLGAPVYLKNDRGLIYYENFRLYYIVYAFFISLIPIKIVLKIKWTTESYSRPILIFWMMR